MDSWYSEITQYRIVVGSIGGSMPLLDLHRGKLTETTDDMITTFLRRNALQEVRDGVYTHSSDIIHQPYVVKQFLDQ